MTLPTDDDDAKKRFNATVSHDPFPAIPAALLNSSDIFNYMDHTGMVCPAEEKNLKSASYAIRIGEKCIYWDADEKQQEKTLSPGEHFSVPANSIIFIKTKEKFRLPPYIAMRFNLKINNVHKGILLGTGPLVDPGFEGHLLIPLHNLTTNDYFFHEGQTFVWVEFTKVSPNKEWDSNAESHYQKYHLDHKFIAFPKEKKNLEEWDYLLEAYGGNPIRSSIPESVKDATNSAKKAEALIKTFTGIGILSIVGLGFGLWTFATNQLVDINNKISLRQTEIREAIARSDEQIASMKARLDSFHDDVRTTKELQDQLNNIENEIRQIKGTNRSAIQKR